MDKKDRKIIEHLRQDGRASYTEIADKIGVSEGTVRNRVRKLQESGVIKKFTVEIAKEENISAFVMVNIKTGADIDSVFSGLEVEQVNEVAGSYDAIIRVEKENSAEINRFVDEIRSRDGVSSTETFMILNER